MYSMAIKCNVTDVYRTEGRAVTPIVIATSILSIFGTLVIIATYIAWKHNRTRLRQMLVFLSLADLFVAIGNLYGAISSSLANYNDVECKIQSAVTTFSNLNSFFWTTHIAIYLYVILVRTNVQKAETLIPYFHVTAFGIPGLIISAAVAWDVLGHDYSMLSVGWCWIRVQCPRGKPNGYFEGEILWMLFTGKFWEILAYVIVPVLYILTRVHTNRKIQKCKTTYGEDVIPTNHVLNRMQFKLTIIPILFICLRIWGTIRFLLLISNQLTKLNQVIVDILMILQAIGDSAQGAANCVLYCLLTKHVKLRLWLACRTCGLYLCWCSYSSPREVKMKSLFINVERTQLLEDQAS